MYCLVTIYILVIDIVSIKWTSMMFCKRDKCYIDCYVIHILVADMISVKWIVAEHIVNAIVILVRLQQNYLNEPFWKLRIIHL